jgi:general secretion pathway protein A
MYRTHFGLNRSPFSIEPDPAFLWLGEMHKEALAALRYAVLENKGFLLLTGGVGTGKTSLIRCLLAGLSGDVAVAVIPDPGLGVMELLNLLANELGVAPSVGSKADFLIQFKKFVAGVYGANRRVLIIIDEAQRLTSELLDEIRVLSNIDYDSRKLVNIFFVGQVEFDRILSDPLNRALRQRIALSCRLAPLSLDETGAYIRHRLQVAGGGRALFSPGAVREIFDFSKGIPRLINILCDRALVSGYVRSLGAIESDLVRECAGELDLRRGAAAAKTEPARPAGVAPALPAAAGSPRVVAKSAGAGRRWAAAAALGAAGLLLAALVLTGAPERDPPQMEHPAAERSATAVPKDSSLAAANKTEEDRHAPTRPASIPAAGAAAPARPGASPEKPLEPASSLRAGPLEKMPAAEDPSGASAGQPAAPGRLQTAEASAAAQAEETPVSGEKTFHLFFKPVSAELEEESYQILRQAAALLAESPNAEITLICYPAREDLPFLRAKLAELRATSIKTALTAQPNFKGMMTVVRSGEHKPGSNRQSPAGGAARALAELRIRSGMN